MTHFDLMCHKQLWLLRFTFNVSNTPSPTTTIPFLSGRSVQGTGNAGFTSDCEPSSNPPPPPSGTKSHKMGLACFERKRRTNNLHQKNQGDFTLTQNYPRIGEHTPKNRFKYIFKVTLQRSWKKYMQYVYQYCCKFGDIIRFTPFLWLFWWKYWWW